MKYSQKHICSQEHAIIQTDYKVIQTKMATAIFFIQLCMRSGTGRSGIMATGQRQTRLSVQLRSKAYAVLFLSQQVCATIVANGLAMKETRSR